MKNLKKLLAVVLSVLAVIGMLAVSAGAVTAPTFEVKIASQDASTATFELSITGGKVNTFDIEFTTSTSISSVKYILTTDAFDAYAKKLQINGAQMVQSASVENKKISLASTEAIKNTSIFDIVVNKKSSATLDADDIALTFTECIVDDVSIPSSVKVVYKTTDTPVVVSKLDIAEDSISLDYKASKTLTLEKSDSIKEVEWVSSNDKVATVDENGKVVAKGTGSAVITAQTPDGAITDTCNVKVSYTWWQWIIVIVLLGFLWY